MKINLTLIVLTIAGLLGIIYFILPDSSPITEVAARKEAERRFREFAKGESYEISEFVGPVVEKRTKLPDGSEFFAFEWKNKIKEWSFVVLIEEDGLTMVYDTKNFTEDK